MPEKEFHVLLLGTLKTFKVKDKVLNIKNGDYGPYIQIVSGSKKQFVSIPSTYSIENMNIDDVLKIIADKNGTSKSYSSNTKSKYNKKTKEFDI